MASFTLTGTPRLGPRRRAALTWTDGRLSGDPALVLEAEALAKAFEGQPVAGGMSAATTHDHLTTASSAYALMQGAFADAARLTHGSVPDLVEDEVGG